MIVTINTIQNYDLGLKIVVAKDKYTNKSFAVIIEVNPIGIGYKEHIEPGDILLAINGMNIETYETLQEFIRSQSLHNERGHQIQLEIQKKGAFDVSGLFSVCLNSPCSDFCQVWDSPKLKSDPRKDSVKSLDRLVKIPNKPASPKAYVNDQIQRLQKPSCASSEESSRSINHILVNTPKYKYQKALPMKRRENEQRSYKTTLKPRTNPQSHIISPPQPQFIKRKTNPTNEQMFSSNLKESKSLTNLTSFSSNNNSKNQSSNVSLSNSTDSSDDENIYVRKPALPGHVMDYKKYSLDGLTPLNNTKNLSKSTDLLLTDLKKELILLKLKQDPSVPWGHGIAVDKGLSKNSPTNQSRY